MYDSFGVFLAEKEIREPLANLLGLSLGPQIETLESSFGEYLIQIINFIFTFFRDSNRLAAWNSFLQEVRESAIPNIYNEWIDAKIELAINDPTYGKEIKTLLRTIILQQKQTGASNEFDPEITAIPLIKSRISTTLHDLELSTKIPKDRLENILDILKGQLSILQEDQTIDQNGIPQSIWYLDAPIDLKAIHRLLIANQTSAQQTEEKDESY